MRQVGRFDGAELQEALAEEECSGVGLVAAQNAAAAERVAAEVLAEVQGRGLSLWWLLPRGMGPVSVGQGPS